MEERLMYKKLGFSNRMGFGRKPALLIIDFIKGFTNVACPLGSNLDNEIKATKKLLLTFREKSLPVHFTTTVYDEKMISAGVFFKKVPSLAYLKKNSEWTEVDERLKPNEGEIVWVKQYASAFFGTSLSSTLRAQNVDTVIITGCTTSGCIRASAVDSCQLGFYTIVVQDCVGDRSQYAHKANLFDLDAKYADVVTIQEVIEYTEKISSY